jgi:hypothetical protein
LARWHSIFIGFEGGDYTGAVVTIYEEAIQDYLTLKPMQKVSYF